MTLAPAITLIISIARIVRSCFAGRAFALLFTIFALCCGPAIAAEPVPADNPPENALGLHTDYLKELDTKLGIAQAIAAYSNGNFQPGNSPVLNFGIGSRPVWIRFEVANRSNADQLRRLSVETSWLDKVDIYFMAGGKISNAYNLGDAQPFSQRPINNRFFAVDHEFVPGTSEVYLRIETSDPMVVPIFLRTPAAAASFDTLQDYIYGFVYGFLLSLMAYNAMLYIGLRNRRYQFYSLYIAVFILLNLAYTGHGFEWLWPEQVRLQLWIIPFLMFLLGLSGLLFASSFLNTRSNFPRMHRALIWFCGVSGLLLMALFAGNYNALHMVVAFVFFFLFTGLMILLGMLGVLSGYGPARYFLFGSISAMLGALMTDLAVAGFIPYNAITYRTVEFGMLIDGTVLALALAYQFRVGQQEKLQAERMARVDPLTNLNNRRAFYELTRPIWSNALRNQRNIAVILLDIDQFKKINDGYGHAIGDEVLIAVATILAGSARKGDVVARWGGEEFILLLPETNLEAAISLADRLRINISETHIAHEKGEICFTASFGVALRHESCVTIDALTSIADDCLYQAKRKGKNQVSHSVAA